MSTRATEALDMWNAHMTETLMTDEALQNKISRTEHADRKVIRSDVENTMVLNAVALMALHGSNASMHEVHAKCMSGVPKYTLGTLASGGCIDTIAAINTGLLPIWGTEVCERKRALWRRLTRSPDMGIHST